MSVSLYRLFQHRQGLSILLQPWEVFFSGILNPLKVHIVRILLLGQQYIRKNLRHYGSPFRRPVSILQLRVWS